MADIFSVDNFRKPFLKFFEDLFRHILQETEGIELTAGYDFSPEVRKLEKFAAESGFIPASEVDAELEYESQLEYAIALSLESAITSSSGSAIASSSGSAIASSSRSAIASSSRSAIASSSGSAIASSSGSAIASSSEYAIASSSSSAIASSSGSASGFKSTSAAGFEFDFSDLFNSYDRNLGLTILRVLAEVAGTDIDRFYQSIKEYIQVRENLKILLKRLAHRFLHASPEQELYFFAVISRIFALLYKTGGMDPKIFIEEVVDVILEGESDFHFLTVDPSELLFPILNGCDGWMSGFQGLKCGKASDYFF